MTKLLILTAACASIACASSIAHATDIQFEAVDLADIKSGDVTVSKSVYINGRQEDLQYDELYRTGQVDPKSGEMYGLMKDYLGNPAFADPGSSTPYLCSGNYAGVQGSGTDFSALIEKHGKKYMISQFECENGGMYTTELKQMDSGELQPVPGTLQFVDHRDEWGGWVHCAGSVTPMNTYLGGEEYEPNARTLEADPASDAYYSDKVESYWLGDYSKSSPYHNGWITEVDIDKEGKASYVKHYTMGRFAHELGYVMPDGKTVYLTDDGTNGVLFMFVASQAGDLSKGTLYAARWNQTSGAGTGSADLDWINLGNTSDKEVKQAIKDGVVFSDLFDVDTPACKWIGANGVAECLEVKPGKELLASRLESRRFAALRGGTHEFRKMEGFTFNPARDQAYIAISEVARGMLEMDSRDYLGQMDIVTGDHIRLAQADYCGAVYSMDLASGRVKDTGGNRIRSRYVMENMNTLISSGGAPGSTVDGNTCADMNLDLVAQPDNISMIKGSNALLIGEDGSHDNNMLWSYNLDSGVLTRILTVPEGAETTSPYLHRIGDEHYLTVVTQHPDPSSTNAYGDTVTGVIRLSNSGYDFDYRDHDYRDHDHEDDEDDFSEGRKPKY